MQRFSGTEISSYLRCKYSCIYVFVYVITHDAFTNYVATGNNFHIVNS